MDFPRAKARIADLQDRVRALDRMLEDRAMERQEFDSFRWQHDRFNAEIEEIETLISLAAKCKRNHLTTRQLYLLTAVTSISVLLSGIAMYAQFM